MERIRTFYYIKEFGRPLRVLPPQPKKRHHPFGWCLSLLRNSVLIDLRVPGGERGERCLTADTATRASGSGLYFQGGSDRRRKYRAPQQGVGSSVPSATNNANRFRYRRRKSSNHNGYWIFLSHFSKWNWVDIIRPKRLSGGGLELNTIVILGGIITIFMI